MPRRGQLRPIRSEADALDYVFVNELVNLVTGNRVPESRRKIGGGCAYVSDGKGDPAGS